VIVNPARVTGLAELRAMIHRTVTAAGWPVPEWFETTVQDPGTGQARRAVADGAEVVFVCGGDGTIRAAVAGLAGTGATLAILPAGTGNLLAVNLAVPLDLQEAVQLALTGDRRKLDAGAVDGEMFAVMAGMGFDAAMMGSASRSLKALVGAPAYVVSALRHLRDRPMRVVVRIDDQEPRLLYARSVLIGNVGSLQGGIRLMPDARPDSGAMEVAILTPRHLGHWAALAGAVVLRRKRVPRMTISRGNHVFVLSDRAQPRQLDGDVIAPSRSLTVTVVPAALQVCVPARSTR
jgi:diacylglycerol kinase family enzyme